MMEKLFGIQAKGSTIPTEIIAGAATFMTMSYIIFVQPIILSGAGMNLEAVFVATCLASAAATLVMGLVANYPIALAPAMGHNVLFVIIATTVAAQGAAGEPAWPRVLGAVFIAGCVFMVLSLFRFRARLVDAIPESLKNAIAVGIGLLITLVGLEYAGLVVDSESTLVFIGDILSPHVLLVLGGTLFIAILLIYRVKGAILWGILATALGGLLLGIVKYEGLVAAPPSLAPTLFRLDIGGALTVDFLVVIFVFLFLDLFDTVGTLIGVSERGGLMVEGRLPRIGRAFFSDAFGTVFGALLGTSTVTSYVESTAGINAGGRTGLANVVTAALFLLALFFVPLVRMVGGAYILEGQLPLYPVIAPALLIVGVFMMAGVRKIDWDDYTEAVPAFFTLIIMPFAFSIAEGIGFGFVTYSLLKLAAGRGKEVRPFVYACAGVFIILIVLRRFFL
ncbi:MAG TPA: NCS2 family permease [Firmicutes bacterium]|nr:NCS2 family permease [Bacillota bacterium]